MQLVCPKCGSRFEMEQAVRELEQSETHDIAAKLGVHWRLVNEYSDCWRQSEFGDVGTSKRLRILRSTARLIDTLAFTYRGRRYRTSQHDVIRVMTEICNLQKWGFTNHNYLYSILAKRAERLSAEGLSAAEERQREENRRTAEPQNRRTAEPERMDYRAILKTEG